MHRRDWRPVGTTGTPASNLNPGALIAYDHAVWRVIEVSRRDHETHPVVLVIRPVGVETVQSHDSSDQHIACGTYTYMRRFTDPDHYPVCVKCHEPMPCREQMIIKATDEAAKRAARYELPGVCPACQEPVTDRQLRQSWSENLVAFTGQPVTIHLRQKCIHEAQWYDALWRENGHVSNLGYQAEGNHA